VLAGPYCTLLLADLGARVIKVERPPRGDDARAIPPMAHGRSAYFASVNRGKESIALELREPRDRRIFEGLLARSDALVENFRPGVLERLGYGWETLRARHPRLIVASVSGFGQDGPYARRAAYDLIVQAMGGLMSLTGEPGGAPVRVGTSIGDLAAGLFTALGVASALYHRERTGRGTRIDVAMLDCQVALLENAVARFAATGRVPGPLGSRHPSIAPFEAYAVGEGHLVLAAGNDALFARLAGELGRPELARDPRFADNESRTLHADALKEEIEEALAARPAEEWIDRLLAAGVPCAPIQSVAQLMEDPQVAARRMLVRAGADEGDGFVTPGQPVKSPDFEDPAVRPPAPELDAHRARLLAELGEEDERS
jgi:CoA:oxalate CoA-transferase